MDISAYIKRMNQLYGSEQQVASNPLNFPEHMIHQYEGGQLTPEEFYQHQSIPQSERPLTGAEGGRVYDTRKYFKPGGLVEPGVTHYGKRIYDPTKIGPTTNHKFNLETNKWEFTHKQHSDYGGQITKYIQKSGETKNQFFKRIKDLSKKRFEKMYTDVSTKASLVQQKIDNWTKTWVQDNIGKYDIRDLDNFKSDLKKAWEKELKINSYGGGNKPPSTKQGYPSVSHSKRKNPLELEGFVRNADQPRVVKKTIGGGQLTDIFFDKVFYRNKIRTTPEFKNKISNYMDFITMDKRNMHDAKGRFMKAEAMDLYKKVLDKDVVYLLSKDSNLLGSQKNIVFTSFDKSFSDKYNAYIDKVNRANEAYKKNISIIEKTLGKKQGTIFNQMKKEGKALRKIFDVSNLPSELLYSMDHVHGISAAAQSGNKIYMQRAVDDMIGMTMGQNKALGYGGYSHNRNELMRKINAGESVKKNLAELNELAKSGYGDYFKGKGNAYEIKNKKVVPTKKFSFPTTREQRFGQYFKELYKTKKGKAEIIRQHGSYKNLIEKIGCPGLAAGGRVSFKDGTTCYTRGMDKIKTGNITTAAEKLNFTKLAQTLGPDGWRFLGVDYDDPGRIGRLLSEVGEGVARSPTAIRTPLQLTGKLATGVGRFLADPFFFPLIPLEMMVTSAYGFEKNKDNIMKSLKDNPFVSKMARKYNMDVKDVRNAILEKYRRAVLNAEGGLEEQMAFEPKHDEAVNKFDKEFYPFWEDYEQRPHMDTSFVEDPAFSTGLGSAMLGMRQESEEEEYKLRAGEVEGTQFYKKQPFYTKKEYYPEDYEDKTLAGQIKSAERIPFENLRGLEDPLPEGGFYKGGRVPFGKGKLVDEGRRAFMKWLAGITGATVAAGTGLIKWGAKKGAGKTVIKAGDTIVQGTQGMPDWYIPLINRIVNEGTDVTKKLGTVEREIVHTKKIGKGEEATVYQNLDTGNVRVEYQSAHSEVPIQMEYKAPQVIEEGKHAGQKTDSEFSAVEAEPRWQQTAPDDADLTFEGENIVGRVEDLTTDTSKLKEFGKNKKLTIKEKIEAKKKQDYRKSLEHDSETQADYIETKYGPGPEPDVGMDEFGNLVDEYGEIID